MAQKLEAGDGRQRQGRRDEKIRKKLQAEMNKRKKMVGTTASPRKAAGSVMSLKPLAPITMELSTTVLEAAQYMGAHRSNCVLVVDDGGVCGIFTAKDIAFKVVGGDHDPRTTRIADIMTANPMVANVDTSATDALNMMVERGFRHLPVVDAEGEIAGVLDITKCFHEAMNKLERAYESSRKLQDALDGVQLELGNMHPAQMVTYVETLRERTASPNLASVLDGREPIYVDARTPVVAVAKLMRENRTTAVLVTDNSAITGIFTTKDVVLRVLAAGLDPAKCSVVRVMTPQPDLAPSTMNIQDALRKMHKGHFLNLPVVDHEDNVLGIVDVLKLTYATLEQINGMSSAESGEGPAWNKFWMSLDETESVHSELSGHQPTSSSYSDSLAVSQSELAQFNIPEIPEIAPEDSLSRTGQRLDFASDMHVINEARIPETFPIKFKAPQGRVHRIVITPADGLHSFRDMIKSKLTADELAEISGSIEGKTEDLFAVSYKDEDGDLVSITTDEDVAHVVKVSQRHGATKAEVILHSPAAPPSGTAFDPLVPAAIAGGIALVGICFFAFRGKK